MDIGDESNTKLVKIDEVKKKPKWLEMVHSERIMLDKKNLIRELLDLKVL